MGMLGCTLVTAVQQAHLEGVFWGTGPDQACLGSSFTSTLMMTVSHESCKGGVWPAAPLAESSPGRALSSGFPPALLEKAKGMSQERASPASSAGPRKAACPGP